MELRGGQENAGAESGQGCVWLCTDARACRRGDSPVLMASVGGHVSCVEILIRAKADVLQRDQCVGWMWIEGLGFGFLFCVVEIGVVILRVLGYAGA
jgi:hypothetical protein